MRLLLAGYLGCGNLGDDAILVGFSEACANHNWDITVLSGMPEETFRLYGFRSVPRKDLRAVQEAIEACDALVFPGGSIFQDVTSVRSTAYYSNLIGRAKKARKKVALLGQGVGPVNSFFGKRFTQSAFNSADAIVVRDPASAQTLRNLGIKSAVHNGADMAFLMPPPRESQESSYSVGDMKTIGLAPRPFGKETGNITKLFAEFARMLFQANFMPVLIELDGVADRNLIAEISKASGGKIPDIKRLQTPMNVQVRMSRMEAVVAMRLHAGILAATVGVPSLMIAYDPKVSAFAKQLELPPALDLQAVTSARLFENFNGFLAQKEKSQASFERRIEEQRKLAQVNIEVLQSCLKGMSVAQ